MTTERITEIAEFEDQEDGRVKHSGYKVYTTQQSITLCIKGGQRCCERFGYFWCNENPDEFIGANLLSVRVTDDALSEGVLKENDLDRSTKYFQGRVMFINLETDRGTLQFVAYNEHNGFYGHEALVKCSQLDYSECL